MPVREIGDVYYGFTSEVFRRRPDEELVKVPEWRCFSLQLSWQSSVTGRFGPGTTATLSNSLVLACSWGVRIGLFLLQQIDAPLLVVPDELVERRCGLAEGDDAVLLLRFLEQRLFPTVVPNRSLA